MGEIVREPSIDKPYPELPSDDLMFRIAGTADSTWFWKSGQISIDQFNSILGHLGKSFTDFPRALDFGCGCGRIELHLQDAARAMELYAVDIDREAIAWAKEHAAWAEFSVNQEMPPLEFPDEYFDLIFNHSVFTHLDEQYQDAWLVELERVTKPGGLLILSVSGDYPFSLFDQSWIDAKRDPGPLRETFRIQGHLFISDDGMLNSPFPDFYHTTFHAAWYIFERWGSIFDIKAYIVRGDLNYQDLLLLQRREEPVGSVRRGTLRSELFAELNESRNERSQLGLSLSKCENDKQYWQSIAEASQSDMAKVLSSRSWRLTAPLRSVMSRLRGK